MNKKGTELCEIKTSLATPWPSFDSEAHFQFLKYFQQTKLTKFGRTMEDWKNFSAKNDLNFML